MAETVKISSLQEDAGTNMIEQVAQAILAKILEINSEIAGHPVEADEFAIMCAYEYASAALSAMPERELLREALEALSGVIRVADRKTVEFDAARAAADKIRAVLNDRQ